MVTTSPSSRNDQIDFLGVAKSDRDKVAESPETRCQKELTSKVGCF